MRAPAGPLATYGGIAIFAVAVAFGWTLGAPSPGTAGPSPVETRTSSRATKSKGASRSAAMDIAGKRLASIRAATHPTERMRATIDLANSIHPSEFAAWMGGGWFNLRGGPELTLFTKIIEERWKEEDPEGLLLFSIRNRNALAETLLTDWAEKDPRRILDFFSKHPGEAGEVQSLVRMASFHPEMALLRFGEIATMTGAEDVSATRDLIHVLAGKSPAALQAALDALPAGMRSVAESALSKVRMEASFSEELRHLSDRPDGLRIFMSNAAGVKDLGGKVLAELANLPPDWCQAIGRQPSSFVGGKSSEGWLDADLEKMGFSPMAIRNIQGAALNSLVASKPEEALKWISSMDLSEEARRYVISNMIAAHRDGEKIAGLIAKLPIETDRIFAEQMLTRDTSREQPGAKVETPDEWLQRAGGSDIGAGEAFDLGRKFDQWDEATMSRFAQKFEALTGETKARVARAIALNTTQGDVSSLAGDAIRYLVENPPSQPAGGESRSSRENPDRMASTYAVQLSEKNPEAAGEWIGKLPAGEAKYWAARNLINNWNHYDPKAADKWQRSLPASERAAIGELGK